MNKYIKALIAFSIGVILLVLTVFMFLQIPHFNNEMAQYILIVLACVITAGGGTGCIIWSIVCLFGGFDD